MTSRISNDRLQLQELRRFGMDRLRLFRLWICVSLLTGCASYADRSQAFRREYFDGNLVEALKDNEKLSQKALREAEPLALDRAMIDLASGNTKRAQQTLRKVREKLDYFEQKDVGEKVLTTLTDDTTAGYAGEDHERILVRGLLAVTNLFDNGHDVYAYSLQMNEKQQRLIEQRLTVQKTAKTAIAKRGRAHPPMPPAEGGIAQVAGEELSPDDLIDEPSATPSPIALGAYLRAMMHEENPTEIDELRHVRDEIAADAPEFADGPVDQARAESGPSFAPGCGAIYVLAFVGRGPHKEEVSEIPTQIALFLADRILSMGRHSLPPTIAPVRVPIMVRSLDRIDHLEVNEGGRPLGRTSTLVNVGELACAHDKLRHDEAVARALVRRLTKKGAIYAVKEGIQAQKTPGAELLLDLAGIAWEATEVPDTRCWSLLPDRIQAVRLELPAGRHQLALRPADRTHLYGIPTTATVDVRSGRFSCVLVNFPDERALSTPLVTHGSDN